MVAAEELDTTKSYKYKNGTKLGKYVSVFTHVKEADPDIQPPLPPQYYNSYQFKLNVVPSFNLDLVIEDLLPAGGRGRYRTTRRKQLRRFRKSHKKIIKNNKK